MITLHLVADGSDPRRIDRGIDYIVNTKQPQATVAGGAQIDIAMNIVERIHARAPNCLIFWRVLEDTGNIFAMNTTQWWSERVFPRLKWMQDHRLIMVVDNESSGDDNIIRNYTAQSIERMQTLHAAGLYGAFCRFATGNIVESQYVLLKPLLEKLDARDWISPNEYTNLPGKSSGGHLERYKKILEVVPGKHFNVAIGECGVLNDYQSKDGYLGKISGSQMAAALLADEVWYYGGSVPRHLFCIGGFGWPLLQVNDEALNFLEDYYAKNPIDQPTPPPTPTPSPVYTPDPFTPGMKYVITTPGAFVNVRATPSTQASKLGEILNKNIVTVYEEALVGSEYWRRMSVGTLNGWVSMQQGTVKLAPYLPDSLTILRSDWQAILTAQAALDSAIKKAGML